MGRKSLLTDKDRQKICEMREKGFRYKEIAAVVGLKDLSIINNVLAQNGLTRQNSGHSGARDYADIRNTHIREAMRAKQMNKKDFARYLNIGLEKANGVLYGDRTTRLTIDQVKRILRLTDSTFEEVFGNG